MLSVTNTIVDVKSKLVNDYSYFEFASDLLFTAALTSIADDVYLIQFLPRIGSDEYDTIKAKDKTGLTEYQTYLYWAEVYSICHSFLTWRGAKDSQLQNNTNESLRVEGYAYSIGTSEGSAPGDRSVRFYYDKMFSYWKLAGFNIAALERTCTIFGDSANELFGRTILE